MTIREFLFGPKPHKSGTSVRTVTTVKPAAPEWGVREPQFAPWARKAAEQSELASITIEIDTAAAMAYWLGLLGVPSALEEIDQYWLEVAYQCIKLDTQAMLTGTPYDIRTAEKHALFNMSTADEYAQRNFPVGRGAEAATRGKEARAHYTRIRGAMPA